MLTASTFARRTRGFFAWIRCNNKAVCVATAVVAVVGTISMLSGCAQLQPTHQGLRVVTTTTQITDFTRRIVGTLPATEVEVDGLILSNQSVHEFDPSAKALVELGEADVLVMNGQGLEPWLAAAIDASGFHGTLVDASAGLTIVQKDPHIWTTPNNASHMVTTIASALEKADRPHAKQFRANAKAYEAQLAALNTWALTDIAQVPAAERLLVTNHDGLSYFCRQYGITFVGAIIPSFDDNSEPSVADLNALVAAIKRTHTKAVFSESTISPKLATTIAQEAGVAVYSGPNSLYADTLGPAGSSGATYIDATIHNVSVLVSAWGKSNIPVPSKVGS